MALNLEAVLKFTAKVFGSESVKGLGKDIQGLENVAKSAKNGLKNVVSSDAFKAAAVAAAGLGIAMKTSMDSAKELGGALADIQKVIPEFQSPEGLEVLKGEIRDLSRVLPIATKDITSMYAAASKAGIPRDEVKRFTEEIGKTAIAWDTTGAEAAQALAEIKTALDFDLTEILDLRDAINQLAQDAGISAMELVEFVKRAGPIGKAAGFSAEEVAALGTAMIASGSGAKVAATSFRAMVSAFQSGSSMTDRQVQALQMLGGASKKAADWEKEHTAALQRESKARVDAIKQEADKKLKILDREYRDRMKILQRGWEDEDDANIKGINRRYERLQTGLERQKRAEIDASNERAEKTGQDNQKELDAIDDKYKQLGYKLQDQKDAELKIYRRGEEDKRQLVIDALNDEKDERAKAIRAAAQEQIDIEKEMLQIRLDDAKESAKKLAGEYAVELQKEFNQDPTKVLKEFFERIRNLPAELQGQFVSDFFGDQARAIIPLINNEELLAQALQTAGDKAYYQGSSMKEAAIALGTVGNQIELAKRPWQDITNVIGNEFNKALLTFLKIINPILEKFLWMLENIPGLKEVVAGLAIAFVALVAALPVVATIMGIAQSFVVLSSAQGMGAAMKAAGPLGKAFLGLIGNLLGIGKAAPAASSAITAFSGVATQTTGIWTKFLGLVKGIPQVFVAMKGAVIKAVGQLGYALAGSQWVQGFVYSAGVATGKVVAFFTGLGALIGKALSAIGAILSGPVGWIILAAALITTIVVFREQIADFFKWLGGIFTEWIQNFVKWLEPVRAYFGKLWEEYLKVPVTNFFNWIGNALNKYLVEPIVNVGKQIWSAMGDIWNKVKEPVTAFFNWLGSGLKQWFVDPIVNAAKFVWEAMSNVWNGLKDIVLGFWSWFADVTYKLFVEPFVASFKFVQERWGNFWQIIGDAAKNIFKAIGVFFYELFIAPIRKELDAIGKWFSEVWNNVATAVSSVFTKIANWFSENLVKPIQNWLDGLGKIFGDAWNKVIDAVGNAAKGIVKTVQDNLITPLSNVASGIARIFTNAWKGIVDAAKTAWSGVTKIAGDALAGVQKLWGDVGTWFSNNVGTPITNAFNAFGSSAGQAMQKLGDLVKDVWTKLTEPITNAFQSIATAFTNNLITPLTNAWKTFVGKIAEFAQGMMTSIGNAFNGIANIFKSVWQGVVDVIKGALNTVIGVINKIIGAANRARGVLGMSALPTIPAFGEGGYVTKGTLAVVGEAGPEYVIPADKMRQAAEAYLAGVRGERVLSAQAQPELKSTPSSPARMPIGSAAAGSSTRIIEPVVNITTGQVVSFNGEEYVTRRDLAAAVSDASRQTAAGIMEQLRQPSTRQRLGIR